jgi:DNA polymerase (family X)
MKNKEIAEILGSLADIFEIAGQDPFRVGAYRKAARIVDDLPTDVAELAASGSLTDIAGIGKGTAAKIEEYLATGSIAAYEEAKKTIPAGLVELLSIPGLGPKTVGLLWRNLGVKSLRGLKRVIRGRKILELPGIGPKKVENIEAGVRAYESRSGRLTLGGVLPTARSVLDALRALPGVERADLAGSVRRWRETIGDIDVLAASRKPAAVIKAFTALPVVDEVLAAGTTKASVRVAGALQIDLRVVPTASYGAALVYFTGSKAHNVRLRGLAQDKGLKLNEYGLYRGTKAVAARTEEAVYARLGPPLIPPELREDRGEVEAGLGGTLPELVETRHIRGDLHLHSNWSDGASSIKDIVRAARARGYAYAAVTDHTRSLGIAHGLSIDRLEKQLEEIAAINKRLKGFTVFSGAEVDILADGRLDLPDEVLDRLDVVIASIHSGFQQPEDRITGRIVSAIENPRVDIIGHPTGRLLGSRPEYAVDLDRVMEAAARTRTALEINCYHERLDLNDVNARRAVDLGIRLALGTDAHHADQLWMMDLGVATARRAWVGPRSVLNTRPKGALLKELHGNRDRP